MTGTESDPGTGDDPDEERLLFVVQYDSDAERKRVEYLFDNVDGDVGSLDGLARVTSGVDRDEIYERLVSKVPAEQVSAYRLDALDVNADPETVTVSETVEADRSAVETFVEYILSKKKAVLQSGEHNEYEVYTKKGRAEVTYQLGERSGSTTVRIRITGYPPAPTFLADFFETELDEYARSQRA